MNSLDELERMDDAVDIELTALCGGDDDSGDGTSVPALARAVVVGAMMVVSIFRAGLLGLLWLSLFSLS